MSATPPTTLKLCPLQGETGLLLLKDHDLHELTRMGYCLDEDPKNPRRAMNYEGTIYVSLSRREGVFIQHIKIELLEGGLTFINEKPYDFYTSKCLVLLRRTID